MTPSPSPRFAFPVSSLGRDGGDDHSFPHHLRQHRAPLSGVTACSPPRGHSGHVPAPNPCSPALDLGPARSGQTPDASLHSILLSFHAQPACRRCRLRLQTRPSSDRFLSPPSPPPWPTPSSLLTCGLHVPHVDAHNCHHRGLFRIEGQARPCSDGRSQSPAPNTKDNQAFTITPRPTDWGAAGRWEGAPGGSPGTRGWPGPALCTAGGAHSQDIMHQVLHNQLCASCSFYFFYVCISFLLLLFIFFSGSFQKLGH